MKTRRNRVSRIEWSLLLVYAALVGLAIYLNPTGTKDLENLIVNCVFFAVTAVIFLYVMIRFTRTDQVVRSFLKTSAQVKALFDLNHSDYIWDTYQEKNEIFEHPLLDHMFREYRDECKRLNKDGQSSYRCNIEDYLNRNVIDHVMSRTILSLVPGTMTGLGILGTFVGLSFGLNSFSTGTTTEITQSITPLMNGIKVAFHTSIYGMVFSLVFNFIYKYKLAEAYAGLDQLLDAFSKYVVPDAQNENMNGMLRYQKQQAENTQNLVRELGEVFAQKISDAMKPQQELMYSFLEGQKTERELITNQMVPQIKEMRTSLELFAKDITEEQTKGMQVMVDRFINQLNASVDGAFDHLKDTIEETCKLQKDNGQSMKDALLGVAGLLGEVKEIDDAGKAILTDLTGYIQQIEALQTIINDNFMSVNMQLEDNLKVTEKQQRYIEELTAYEANVSQLSSTLSDTVQVCCDTMRQMSENTKQQLTETAIAQMKEVAANSSGVIERIGKKSQESEEALIAGTKIQLAQLVKTVQGATGDMDSVRKHLNDTTAKMMEQTEKTITSSYAGMGTMLSRLHLDINNLVKAIDELNKNRIR